MKPPALTPEGRTSLLWVVLGITVGLGLALPTWPVTAWPLLALILLIACNYLGYNQRIALSPGTVALGTITLLALLIARRHGGMQDLARGWMTSLSDRVNLARFPNIFPQQLWDDHPQRLFLHAPHSHTLRLRWAAGDQELPLQSLGEGLFRWDFDPRQQPLPTADPSGLVGLRLDSDGDGSRTIWLRLNRSQARPGALCGDPASGLAAAVSESSDEVFVVDRGGNSRRYSLPDGPDACCFIGGGRLAVTCRYDRSLCALDLVSGNVTHRLPLDAMPDNLAVSRDGKRLAVLCEGTKPRLILFSLPQLQTEATLELPAAGEFLCFGRDAREVVVASRRGRCLMRVVGSPTDPSQWAIQGGLRKLPRPATGLCASPQGEKVYFTSTSGQIHVGEQRGNHYVRHSLATVDLARWYFTNVRSTESRTSLQQEPGDIDSGCDAQSLSLASGDRLLLAFTGTHEVAVFPLQEGLDTRVNLSPKGFYCPQGVADLGQGVILVSYPAQGALVWLDRSLSISRVLWAGMSDKELATHDSQAWLRRQGEIGFCESTRTGISCMSCHPGGDSDFACHDIGAGGMWGTLGCRGLAATGPFLRNGGYPDLADLHTTTDIVYRGFRRGATSPRPQALKAFLYALSGPVNPRQFSPETHLEEERRGYQAFIKARCGDCHAPPAFTNLASVTRNTLFPQTPAAKETPDAADIGPAPTGEDNEFLKVPSLRGLWCSGPYLHDNRAATLEDVLSEHNQANQHGDTASLSPAEKRDLVRFLESL